MARSTRRSPGSPTVIPARETALHRIGKLGWRRALNLMMDSLREHPIFDLDSAATSNTQSGIVEAAELDASQREPIYQDQWLRIFTARLRLAALIGALCLLFFTSFYRFIFPEIKPIIWLVTAVAVAGMGGQIFLSFRTTSLLQARLLALSGFLFFSLTTVVGLSLVSAPPTSASLESARAVQFVLVVSFSHILITSLVLPLRLCDTLAISVIVVGSLVLGLHAIPLEMRSIPVVGALWSIGTFALFVTLLSHFTSRLRRRVFDSAFDLAMQALELKAMSETDALTSGFNRRHSERVLSSELLRSARFDRPLSVLMFDLDNFKPVNDTLGHGAGDLVLIAVHQAASAELREVDDLARIGGDEFLIVLPETDQRQTQRIARRLHTRVTRELETRFGNQSLLSKVTISVGALTLDSGHNLEMKAVFERVDELLYRAKKAGKNRVVLGLISDL